MASPSKRRELDVKRLVLAGFEVDLSDVPGDFHVKFHGPSDSLYTGGIYRIHVTLPLSYPYKSPSIGFSNRIFHPNVDEASGSVCLDVINQTWSPMYDLVAVFNHFLPQLLLYPNANDPLNPHAASIFNKDFNNYQEKVKSYVKTYASDNFKMGSKDDDSDDDSKPLKSKNVSPNEQTPKLTPSNSMSASSTPIVGSPMSQSTSLSSSSSVSPSLSHTSSVSMTPSSPAIPTFEGDDGLECDADAMSEVDEPTSEIDDIVSDDEDGNHRQRTGFRL